MTDEILKRIDAIAIKLGVTADHIWGVLVRQARVEFIEWIAWAVLWALAAVLASWFYRKQDPDEPEIRLLFGLAFAISVLLALGCMANTLTLVMNPEYWALRQITSMLGGK